MTSGGADGSALRRAVILMTASSLLVPAAGILTQPILAQALGVAGRGELAAAMAPTALALAVATFGLPDALTYHLAKYPHLTRPAVLRAGLVTIAIGLVCLLATGPALPFLSAGDANLAFLIVLGMALTVPALVVGVLRGAASGRQMWAHVAVERLVTVALRIGLLAALWATGSLTVLTAVLVSTLAPVAAGLVYWRLLLPEPTSEAAAPSGALTSRLLSFGGRVWLGAVAEMLLARVGQVLMTPLAGVLELGLYTVSTTIADVPLVVAIAIQDTLFGVSARNPDAVRLTAITRTTTLVALTGCTLLAATFPSWIGPLFGDDFRAAVLPTIVLMASAVLCIPGLMAATAVSAWGRPGLRSTGLALTLVTNLGTFVVLVPPLGAMGGAWASLASNVVMTSYMVLAARAVLGVRVADLLVPGPTDVARLWSESGRLVRAASARLPGRRDPA